MSFFDCVPLLPKDPIMALPGMVAADIRPGKVNLGIGSYKNDQGLPMILSCVKQAENQIFLNENHKEYLPIDGCQAYIHSSMELIFGQELFNSLKASIYAAQAVGGTSALSTGAFFLRETLSHTIFLPAPTWPNHSLIFKRSGFEVNHYRYYDETTRSLDFNGLCDDIRQMQENSIILLHAVCHNPSGIDLDLSQWQELSSLIKKQKIIPFFDLAYQGFSDSIDRDAEGLRYFAAMGHEMLVANSFSKNFGLYNERVGTIAVISQKKNLVNIASQVKQLIRANYSNPPYHGAQIVKTILQDKALKTLWLEELATMRNRMKTMRQSLMNGLTKCGGHDWKFLEKQNGFFSFSSLNPSQVEKIAQKYAIYMPENGRINVAGLNESNLPYVITAIHDVIQSS